MKTDIRVLDRLILVNLEVHIWSARKKLSPRDLGNAELPPEDLASLGSKRICNPEDLRVFGMLKARAVNALERRGVRFLSGWAVPEEKIDEIIVELDAIRDAFLSAKEDFLKRYALSIQDWIAKHPSWAGIIADSVVGEDYVRSRLDFRRQVYRVGLPQGADEGRLGLREEVEQLGESLFDEIAKAAVETWKRCYAGKTEITRKALSPLKTMHDKLLGLSFVEPCAAPVAELIRTAFRTIPKRGAISGGTLVMLQGLVCLLQNPKALLEHGRGIIDGTRDAQDVLVTLSLKAEISGVETDPAEGQPISIGEAAPPLIASCGLW